MINSKKIKSNKTSVTKKIFIKQKTIIKIKFKYKPILYDQYQQRKIHNISKKIHNIIKNKAILSKKNKYFILNQLAFVKLIIKWIPKNNLIYNKKMFNKQINIILL